MTRVLLVTGLSGAGRSTALKALEDFGFEAVDNLPVGLLRTLLRPSERLERDLAIGIDSRSRAFDPAELLRQLEPLLHRRDLRVRLIYLDCEDQALLRRFTETRRRHPLALDRPVADGIARERRLMEGLRDRADLVIDTSQLTPGDLRHLLAGHFGGPGDGALNLAVTSFSYGRGLPREADLVFDARFLRNPHYVDELRPLTGRDPRVQAYVEADPMFGPFIDALGDLLLMLLPCFRREGKSYLTVAIGCTGGRHRSVTIAERLGERLRAHGWPVVPHHRDAPPAEPGPAVPAAAAAAARATTDGEP
ncbi:MAG TPA: RNase adapter RapZ [Geminicoccaceae bacterium]|nr:RNase adapter RapZ [Geminicoccaceae bacterium]